MFFLFVCFFLGLCFFLHGSVIYTEDDRTRFGRVSDAFRTDGRRCGDNFRVFFFFGRVSDGRTSDGRTDGRRTDGRTSDGRTSDGRTTDGRNYLGVVGSVFNSILCTNLFLAARS